MLTPSTLKTYRKLLGKKRSIIEILFGIRISLATLDQCFNWP